MENFMLPNVPVALVRQMDEVASLAAPGLPAPKQRRVLLAACALRSIRHKNEGIGPFRADGLLALGELMDEPEPRTTVQTGRELHQLLRRGVAYCEHSMRIMEVGSHEMLRSYVVMWITTAWQMVRVLEASRNRIPAPDPGGLTHAVQSRLEASGMSETIRSQPKPENGPEITVAVDWLDRLEAAALAVKAPN